MPGAVTTRREGGIVEVTLDRPKANAIDLATSRVMGEVFEGFRDDPVLRVAVLRTAGDRFFSAGWDLKAAAGGDAVDGDYGVGGFGGLPELRDLNKPLIAAVHGLAPRGGVRRAPPPTARGPGPARPRPRGGVAGPPSRAPPSPPRARAGSACRRSPPVPWPTRRPSSCPSGCPTTWRWSCC